MERAFNQLTTATYWLIVLLWLVILALFLAKLRQRQSIDTLTRTLLLVLAIDAFRTLFENLYFGSYWSVRYGFLPAEWEAVLAEPGLLFIPKAVNVLAAVVILALLLRYWYPRHVAERAKQSDVAAASRRQSELLATALEGAASPVLVIDAEQPNLPVIFANRAYGEFHQRPAEEVVGEDWQLEVADEAAAGQLKELTEALRRVEAATATLLCRKPDGSTYWNQIGASIGRLQPDGTRPCVLTYRDVTAAHELETQLRQAQRFKALGQLASGIAHDFNNHLMVILGGAQQLGDSPGLQGVRDRQALDHILRSTNAAATLANRLLDFARRQTKGFRVFEVNAVVAELAALLRRALGREITVRLELTPQPCCIHSDPALLESALLNLCLNARDAMPEGGQILLRTRRLERPDEPAWVSLSVIDQGIGMSEEVKARLFEPFFTTKPAGKGTGLGLPMVNALMQQCSGRIEVTTAPGRGTAVELLFPLAAAPERPLEAAAQASPPSAA